MSVEVAMHACAFFRVRDALITRWTDYMDFRTFSEQTRPVQ